MPGFGYSAAVAPLRIKRTKWESARQTLNQNRAAAEQGENDVSRNRNSFSNISSQQLLLLLFLPAPIRRRGKKFLAVGSQEEKWEKLYYLFHFSLVQLIFSLCVISFIDALRFIGGVAHKLQLRVSPSPMPKSRTAKLIIREFMCKIYDHGESIGSRSLARLLAQKTQAKSNQS